MKEFLHRWFEKKYFLILSEGDSESHDRYPTFFLSLLQAGLLCENKKFQGTPDSQFLYGVRVMHPLLQKGLEPSSREPERIIIITRLPDSRIRYRSGTN
jgi:hypothetical protein